MYEIFLKPRTTSLACLIVVSTLAFSSGARADFRDDIDYTKLRNEYGAGLPSAANVRLLQVEYTQYGNWAPGPVGEVSNKSFNYNVGHSAAPSNSSEYSGHAIQVADYLGGTSTSMTPELPGWMASEAVAFMYRGNLNAGHSTSPISATWDVENHSWSGNDGLWALDILGKEDFRIERDNIVACVGVDDGPSLSQMIANGYNSIAVGVSSGNHPQTGTTLEGAGRMKPDLVAPIGFTSYAAPMVASASMMLIAETNRTSSLAAARNPMVIKALLLAGATKNQFPNWSHSSQRPLDRVFGAGQLNVYNTYKTLVAGQHSAAPYNEVSTTGWDLNTASTSGRRLYYFSVPNGKHLTLSAVLAWYRHVIPSSDYTSWNRTLANLDLKLWTSSGFSLGNQIDSSTSTIDNVEHIYQTTLLAGQYALEVSADTNGEKYGLAWRGTLVDDASSVGPAPAAPTPVPTAAPTPTPVPTARPTPTPFPTAVPAPTAAPSPTPVPTPIPTATPPPPVVVTPVPTNAPTPLPTSLPSNPSAAISTFTSQFAAWDIGGTGSRGTTNYNSSNQMLSVSGAGSLGSNWDSFQFAGLSFSGDTTVTTRVSSFAAANAGAQAGLMLRDPNWSNNNANAAFASILITPNGLVQMLYRQVIGGLPAIVTGRSVSMPVYLRLVRFGNLVAASYSSDNTNWSTLGTSEMSLPASSLVGVVVTSNSTGQLATVQTSAPSISGSAAVNTVGGLRVYDVGASVSSGSASGNESSQLSLTGAGFLFPDRSHEAEALLAKQNGSECAIATLVLPARSGVPPARAGLTLRESLADDARQVTLAMDASGHVVFEYRTNPGAPAVSQNLSIPSRYLLLDRRSGLITAMVSNDASNWTTVGTVNVTFANDPYVCLAVISSDPNTPTTADFGAFDIINH